jgi:nucleotide-binding universal stress UspA family protein
VEVTVSAAKRSVAAVGIYLALTIGNVMIHRAERSWTSETPMSSRTILVPLDGSAESNAALPLAHTLAKATDSSIKLLRVLPMHDQEGMRWAAANLQHIATELAGSGIDVSTLVRAGHASEEILKELRSDPPALTVMRTHGRAGVERAIIGSVTQEVLKHSQVPLVLMRPGQRRPSGIRKLLVPVDGSPGGAVALTTAAGLAHATGAAIGLLEVAVPVAMHTICAYEYGGMSYYDSTWDEEALAGAAAYVNALLGRLRERGFTAAGEALLAPDVASAVVGKADRESVDLVVMSTHALTGPARALMGSVADAVVRSAHCPVLLVRRASQVATGSYVAFTGDDTTRNLADLGSAGNERARHASEQYSGAR